MSITGDNASNIRAAARLLNIQFYGCFAHILNLIVGSSFKFLELDNFDDNVDGDNSIKMVLTKCRKLVGLFKHSTQLNEQLCLDQLKYKKNNQKVLTLIQDVVTRLETFFLLNKKNMYFKIFYFKME